MKDADVVSTEVVCTCLRHRLNAPRPVLIVVPRFGSCPTSTTGSTTPSCGGRLHGAQLGVISRDEALDVARDRELDLVLVSEKADPPVCRIMDYGKFKFEQEKKAKEAKKSHQTEVKEVKMRYKIDQHDYDVRIGQAQRFLKAGDKVKCTVIFRGREIQHTALAETLLRRMAKDLEEKAEIQQAPKREGRNMIMFLTAQNAAGEERERASRQQGRSHHPSASETTVAKVASPQG